jgi:transposase
MISLYEWFWLYAAVEPESGGSFFLFIPHLNGDCFEIFLQEFRNHFTEHRIGIVLDGASSHRST